MDRRDVARLGHYVVSRRVSLGYRNRTDLADSLPFTVRTLADIEQGVRKANPGTYAMLENKLAWAPGGIDTILAHRRWRGAVTQPTHQLRPAWPPTEPPAPHLASRPPRRHDQAKFEVDFHRSPANSALFDYGHHRRRCCRSNSSSSDVVLRSFRGIRCTALTVTLCAPTGPTPKCPVAQRS